MKISQAAAESGLTVKTVRYYANIGLVCPTIDTATGYRHFDAGDIAKLKFVGTARRFDFSIGDCRELLALYEDKDRPSRDVKKITMNKIINSNNSMILFFIRLNSRSGKYFFLYDRFLK